MHLGTISAYISEAILGSILDAKMEAIPGSILSLSLSL